jgi:hypothetical protein
MVDPYIAATALIVGIVAYSLGVTHGERRGWNNGRHDGYEDGFRRGWAHCHEGKPMPMPERDYRN